MICLELSPFKKYSDVRGATFGIPSKFDHFLLNSEFCICFIDFFCNQLILASYEQVQRLCLAGSNSYKFKNISIHHCKKSKSHET